MCKEKEDEENKEDEKIKPKFPPNTRIEKDDKKTSEGK